MEINNDKFELITDELNDTITDKKQIIQTKIKGNI